MASRTVLARLVLDGVEGVVTGFKKAGSAAVDYGRVSQKAGATATRWVDKHQRTLDTVGGSLLKMGAVGALALGGMAKAAIDWETAWTGVTKTVDGTPDQLAAVEQGLRDMAKVLPTSHKEIAAVAEAAGQLGIKQDAVVGFTRTMIDLGETTNLSSEEAASSLAKMMNIMGTASGDVDRMGSTIVALGNNSATTEADIVAMATRISGVGKQMGLTEADVLSMAAAMSSVGIEAEAGGTAASSVMKKIDAAVREGGEGLENWARIAGVSSEEFASAWETDAAGAVATLTEGLGGMIANGEDANGALKDLGVTGIRESDTLIRLAGATKEAGAQQDLLRESLQLGGEAWKANTALAEEAEKRYSTRASQAKIALNSIKDEAITMGQNLLPVFDSLVSGIGSVVEVLSGMPDGLKSAATNILLIGTAGALAAGGVLKLVVGISRAKTAIATLGITVRTATIAMGAVGVALTVAGTLLSVWMGKQAEAKAKTDAYTDAIRQQGDVIGRSTIDLAAQSLQASGVLDLAESYGANLADVTQAALGNADAMDRVRSSISGNSDEIRDQISLNQQQIDAMNSRTDLSQRERVDLLALSDANQQLQGELAERVAGTDKVVSAIEAEKSAVADATDKTRQMEEATKSGAGAAEESAEAIQASAQASQMDAEEKAAQAAAIQQAVDAQQAMIEETFNLANAMLQMSGSEIGMEASIDSLTETLKKNTEEYGENAGWLDLSRESGRENQKALDDLAQSTMTYTQTLHDQGASAEEIAEKTRGARDAWIETRVAMGGNRAESERLAAALFAVPDQVTSTIVLDGALVSQQQADDLNAAMEGLPDEKRAEIVTIANTEGAEAATAAIAEAKDKTVTVDSEFIPDGVRSAVSEIGGVHGKTAVIDSEYNPSGTNAARSDIASVRDKTVTITTRHVMRGAPAMGAPVMQAHGGVMDFYASGGVRENHVAQIAPAGAWRVWAEPETGGESYIPLHRSKRKRSIDIWEETGRRLGVRGFANGAVLGSSSTTSYGGDTANYYDVKLEGIQAVQWLDKHLKQSRVSAYQDKGVKLNG